MLLAKTFNPIIYNLVLDQVLSLEAGKSILISEIIISENNIGKVLNFIEDFKHHSCEKKQIRMISPVSLLKFKKASICLFTK